MDTVPETFVDAFGEISFKHGMIRIELVSLSGPEPRVTQRLITSLQAFSQMLQAQNGMLEQLEKAGVIRPAARRPRPSRHPSGAASRRRCGGWRASSRCPNPQALRRRWANRAPASAGAGATEIAEF